MRWQDYLFLILLLGGFLLYIKLSRKKRPLSSGARTGRRRQLTRREQAAWRKLQEQGFELRDIHPARPVALTCEQKSLEYIYEGGFTVKRGGKFYYVKIKRGEGSPLTSAGLRNELLLDYLFFQPEGLFLYDVEKDRLQALRFDLTAAGRSRSARQRPLTFILVSAIALALLYHLFFSGGAR